VFGLLEGKNVNLRVAEREDVDYLVECNNEINWGEYAPISEQETKSQQMKYFDNPSNLTILTESKWFIVQKKDGTKIGLMNHRFPLPHRWIEISYGLIPNEQGKGYGTEAVQLMVDYLFLSKDLARIQAIVDVRNKASQRVLEKAGFQREGTMRKCVFNRGELIDYYLYSILREGWKEPKILTKTA
jgi:ribosomal-protein-alanine N-acetyltransferase